MLRKLLQLLTIAVMAVLLNCCFASEARAEERLYYIHSDHLGSTTVVTDESGNVISQQTYYPYGETRSSQLPTTNYPVTERQYTGQISDQDQTGLYYYNARYYNPQSALFTQADSLTDGLNKYSYVHGNPMRLIDPSGNQSEKVNEVKVLVVIYGPVDEAGNAMSIAMDVGGVLGGAFNTQYTLGFKIVDAASPRISQKAGIESGFYGKINGPDTYLYSDYSFDYEKFYDEYDLGSGLYDEAWVFAGSGGHMREGDYFGDNNIPIMGLNQERNVAKALESFGHRVEDSIINNKVYSYHFQELMGREWLRYSWENFEEPTQLQFINGVATAFGIGTPHHPPNARKGAYDYDSPYYVQIPGQSVHNCSLWGCNDEGYFMWWLGQIGKHPEWVKYYQHLGIDYIGEVPNNEKYIPY